MMPQLRGSELAKLTRTIHPAAIVVFMSGYSEQVLVERGLLGEGETLLQKPFEPEMLLISIRELLDARERQVS